MPEFWPARCPPAQTVDSVAARVWSWAHCGQDRQDVLRTMHVFGFGMGSAVPTAGGSVLTCPRCEFPRCACHIDPIYGEAYTVTGVTTCRVEASQWYDEYA